MESVFAWVDFLEEDKEKMHELIKSLSEQDTRDELGIGSIRDAFSNLMFPGTSTIQTRAKYMLFVPWIYQQVEKERLSGIEAAKRTRELEIKLIEALKTSEEQFGLIGREAGEKLQRTPADIYWSGLKAWGILNLRVSRAEYHSFLNKYYHIKDNTTYDDDNNPIDQITKSTWDVDAPGPPYQKEYPEKASFKLTFAQASYLYDKVKGNCSNTVLSELLDHEIHYCDYIWNHKKLNHLNDDLINQVLHAQKFAEIIQGASLLYNLMLAEKDDELFVDKKIEHRDNFNYWKKEIKNDISVFYNWDLQDFWGICYQNGNITRQTKKFVNKWIEYILDTQYFERLPDDREVRNLIYNRELLIKRKRARLKNQRYLKMWGGSSNVSKLDYRWQSPVRYIIADIVEGLERAE